MTYIYFFSRPFADCCSSYRWTIGQLYPNMLIAIAILLVIYREMTVMRVLVLLRALLFVDALLIPSGTNGIGRGRKRQRLFGAM